MKQNIKRIKRKTLEKIIEKVGSKSLLRINQENKRKKDYKGIKTKKRKP